MAVSNTECLGASGMRSLAWQLEAADVDLVVAPGVVDVAGPRLQIHPVAGLPLLHVDRPQYRGAVKIGKLALDGFGATIAMFVVWPLMLLVALLIKLDSRGPVLYKAERIGLNGDPFPMPKFRSMEADADKSRQRLVHCNQAAGPCSSCTMILRVHGSVGGFVVGAWMSSRLINVIRGEMSLVGPRPPLPGGSDIQR